MSSEEVLHASALRSVSQVNNGNAPSVSSQIRKDQRKKLVQQLENMEDNNIFQSSVNDISFPSMQFDRAFSSFDESSKNASNDDQRSARFSGKHISLLLVCISTYSHSLKAIIIAVYRIIVII